MTGTIVEWGELGKVVVASLAAGVGVTVMFSLAIHGAVRFVDTRRDGRPLESAIYGGLMAISLLVCTVALVLGIFVMSR